MGKKSTRTGKALGRAIINARENLPHAKRKRNKLDKNKSDESNVNKVVDLDELDTKVRVMQSVTEQNDLDEFLAKAQLAGTDFTAERAHLSLVGAEPNRLIGSVAALKEGRKKLAEGQQKFCHLLTVPRRPKWQKGVGADELQKMENDAFLTWRRKLAELEENEQVMLTPFERNIEIWRQLWRVVERSDVVVQILDARDPLLFRNEDLEKYVLEIDPKKLNVLLMNKADFLTEKQRQIWCEYFNERKLRVVFWSAVDLSDNKAVVEEKLEELSVEQSEDDEEDEEADDDESSDDGFDAENTTDAESCENRTTSGEFSKEKKFEESENFADDQGEIFQFDPSALNKPIMLSREELMEYFESLRAVIGRGDDELFTVGMVGYPNVGKSSTINKLMTRKKVAVSATPGKTKHFQTLFLRENLMLCDCPGLVMPSLAMSKAQMQLSGILGADQMRQYEPVVELLCTLLPQFVFERAYGLTFPKHCKSHDSDSEPQQHVMVKSTDLMTLYAFVRGFMSSKGLPDSSRAARALVKDFVNGKLRFRHAPPTYDQSKFDQFDDWLKKSSRMTTQAELLKVAQSAKSGDQPREGAAVEQSNLGSRSAEGAVLGTASVDRSDGGTVSETLLTVQKRHLLADDDNSLAMQVDGSFFGRVTSQMHVQTAKQAAPIQKIGERPPKKLNRNQKKDKLRRVYRDLDA